MPIIIKSRRDVEMMRKASHLACGILAKVRDAVAPGVTTQQLHDIARDEMLKAGAISGSLNYPTYKPGEGFPGYVCVSTNEEVVHGVPGPRKLKDGDIVTVDVALSLDGYCGDTSATFPVGQISPRVRKLLEVTERVLVLALENVKPDKKWSDIARLMQWHVEQAGFNVIREFVGHGIGRSMHEDPKVPNFVTSEQLRGDFRLKPGMTMAIEPMVVMGRRDVVLLEDGWSVVTEDRMPAAHFEHTVAVTETGVDVLTDGRPGPCAVASLERQG